MSEINSNNGIIIKDDIYYQIKNGEISFFYKESLLFKHNKNNPVISVVMAKGEAEKEVPLVNYDIKKLNVNEYDIEFYYQVYKIKTHLKLENSILRVKVYNLNNYYGFKVSIRNSAGKIRGFGFNSEEIHMGKEIVPATWKNEEFDDKILAFTKEKKYFLCVEGCYEWKARAGSLIDLYFRRTRFIEIKTDFCRECEDLRSTLPSFNENIFERKGMIIKTDLNSLNSFSFIEKTLGDKVSAVIIADSTIDFWELIKIREKLKSRDIKLLRKVTPKISDKDDYFREFDADDFVKSENGKLLVERGKENFFYFDLSKKDTCRKVKNYIRRIMGTNIDGLLSAEKDNKLLERDEYKEIMNISSCAWQSILYTSSLEYLTPKTLIFDNLCPSTYMYGFYLIDSKKMLTLNYKKYFENLENSGIFNTAICFNLFEGFIYKRLKNKLQGKYNIVYTQ